MDNAKIYVPVDEAWDFFEDNSATLKNTLVEVASNKSTKIFMTENEGKPQLILNINGVDKETVMVTPTHKSLSSLLTEKLTQWYVDYILCDVGNVDMPVSSEVELENHQDEIDDAIIREDALICALDDFLCTVLDESDYERLFTILGYDMFRNVLETICDTLETSYGVYIYWPKIVEDENGVEYVTE